MSEGANCVCCDATVANCEVKCDVVEFSTTRFRLGTLCQRFQIGLKQMSLCHLLRANQNKNWQMEKKNSREIISIKLKVNKAAKLRFDMDYSASHECFSYR